MLFLFIVFFLNMEGLDAPAKAVLATATWMAVWWITEAIPLEATALLPVIIFPLTGAVNIQPTTAAYADRIVFLFLGGFIIATAMEKWNLHKRLALRIILFVGTNPQRVILGFMIATGFLSMWISNTATTLMMMPIAFAVVSQLNEFIKSKFKESDNCFGTALLLGVAYAASIGGMATLIGTPTNAIFAGVVSRLFKIEITFFEWFKFAFPFVAVLLVICWIYIVKIAFPVRRLSVPDIGGHIRKDYEMLGPIRPEEVSVLVVFSATAFAWITRSFFLAKFIGGLDDTIIALSGAVVLFVLPARSRKGEKILDWATAAKMPWGILLLFGGGLALAMGFNTTGLDIWIGSQMGIFGGLAFIVTILFVVAVVNYMTEITSNIATATMILPILAGLSLAIGVHPFGLMVGAVLASSCAFMLPVATPPNAIVFGTGRIRIIDMVRTGFALNVISILLIALYVYFILPIAWGLDIFSHPGF
jgi:solute carrier family 13 (sodium-dependent dicarboxylate transporter), member 2/3/5